MGSEHEVVAFLRSTTASLASQISQAFSTIAPQHRSDISWDEAITFRTVGAWRSAVAVPPEIVGSPAPH